MTTHRIDLQPAFKEARPGKWVGQDKALMSYGGELIGDSRQPLFDAARILLARDLADPDDFIETYRGDTPCLRSKVGGAASLAVSETQKHGPRIIPYKPFPRFAGNEESGEECLLAATPSGGGDRCPLLANSEGNI